MGRGRPAPHPSSVLFGLLALWAVDHDSTSGDVRYHRTSDAGRLGGSWLYIDSFMDQDHTHTHRQIYTFTLVCAVVKVRLTLYCITTSIVGQIGSLLWSIESSIPKQT